MGARRWEVRTVIRQDASAGDKRSLVTWAMRSAPATTGRDQERPERLPENISNEMERETR
jgi:hypothetical protein